MKNGKPSNLFPLLKAVGHPLGGNQRAFEKYFCDGKEKFFGNGRRVWDANGCSNLAELRQHAASHMLHMTKQNCLNNLPPQSRQTREIPVGSIHQLRYGNALNELVSCTRVSVARRLNTQILSLPQQKAYHTGGSFDKSGDAILAAVQRVRITGSFAKIDATVALAKEILENEPAIVIFTSFVAVAKSVHQKLSESGWDGELLTGETPPKKRQPMVDRFQVSMSVSDLQQISP